MKRVDDFSGYIDKLNISSTMRNRIDKVLIMNQKIINDDFKDIIINDTKNQDGALNYNSLWIFSEKYIIECKNFMSETNFDIAPLRKNVSYAYIKTSNFDLDSASLASTIEVYFSFEKDFSGTLTASGINCNQVIKIYKTYIIENIKD